MSYPTRKEQCGTCAGDGWATAIDIEAMVAERRQRGLTQIALAKLAGWTSSQVSMLETGCRPMTAKSAERYWKALQAAGRGA